MKRYRQNDPFIIVRCERLYDVEQYALLWYDVSLFFTGILMLSHDTVVANVWGTPPLCLGFFMVISSMFIERFVPAKIVRNTVCCASSTCTKGHVLVVSRIQIDVT